MIKLNKVKYIVIMLLWSAMLILIVFVLYVGLEVQQWMRVGYQIDELEDRKNRFDSRPDIDDCYFIVSRSIGMKKYDQTIHYGNKCINLGINESPGGYLVNFWVAVSYERVGKTELAKEHLSVALMLDKENRILQNNWIEKMGMVNIQKNE